MKPIPGQYERYRAVLSGRTMPLAFVDMEHLDANIEAVRTMVAGTGRTVRVHSKSVRSPDLLRYILDRGGDEFRGLMTFSARETAMLFDAGFDDFIVAYPTVQDEDIDEACRITAAGATVRLMVDSPDHVRILDGKSAAAGVVLRACLDLDLSWKPTSRSHLGLRRSPVRNPADAVPVIEAARAAPHVILDSVMGYEGHIAGPNDDVPGKGVANSVLRLLKNVSIREFTPRRGAVVRALRDAGIGIGVVNGGGSGSVRSTLRDPSITEITVGSAFFCPGLFWHYRDVDYIPAAFFALQVVRRPAPGILTCQGGGYPASGPSGRDKLPVPVYPSGMRFVDLEGAGEVQTPVYLPADAPEVGLGDPLFFQHAKSGELCERFPELLLVRGREIEGVAATYRSDGRAFV